MIPKGIEATLFFFFAHILKHTLTHVCTHTHTERGIFSLLIKTVFSSVETCQASTAYLQRAPLTSHEMQVEESALIQCGLNLKLFSFIYTEHIGIYSRFCDPNVPASRGLFWGEREVRELEGRQNTN